MSGQRGDGLDLPMIALSPARPVPLYAQLAEVFRRLIIDEVWERGGKLPAEPMIARHFSVSRNTVRQALLTLETEGFVTRSHGRGTHVALPSATPWSMDARPNLAAAAESRGLHLRTEPVHVGVEPTPEWAARLLSIPTGEPSLRVERRRLVADEVVNQSVNHLPASLAAMVLAADLRTTSLYELLRREGNLHTHGATRVITATSLDADAAVALDVVAGEPVVLIESSVWDEFGVVFDCHRVWHRTSVMPLEVGYGDGRSGEISRLESMVTEPTAPKTATTDSAHGGRARS